MFVHSVQHVINRRSPPGRRSGAAVPWFILLLPVFVGGFALAVHLASLSQHQVELQDAAEAAALAGVNALSPVDDTQLFGMDPIPGTTRDHIFNGPPAAYRGAVRDVAVDYAGKNPVGGQNVNLDPNTPASPTTQNANGALVIGTLDNPAATTFDTDLSHTWGLYNPRYNTVRVAMLRTVAGVLKSQDVSASARAFLDRDVIGFKVQGSSQVLFNGPPASDPAIPVLPLAIRTNHTNPLDIGSWDYNIIHRHGTDFYKFDASGNPVGGVLTPMPDGIPEIIVTISSLRLGNGQLAAVGVGTVTAVTGIAGDAANPGQIRTGITYAHLQTYDPTSEQLTLNNGTTANEVSLKRLTPIAAADFKNLVSALREVKGQRRVWLLYDDLAPTATLHVVGFVTARVMDVIPVPDARTPIAVLVVLQPTMLITTDALTDSSRRTNGPRTVFGVNSIFNPYVARARLLR